MVESREDKIERFREFYQQRVASAMSDCNLEHDGLHAKILLCAIIDSLSLRKLCKTPGRSGSATAR